MAIRVFLTCWLIFSLHFATNMVREIYLTISIGDHLSFRVDEYAHLHPDLFEKKGYGWHIGSNPGVSMVAAIPYALARPAIDWVVEQVQAKRFREGQTPPVYNSPWPMARRFFEESWKRGYDVKFGLAALVVQVFCMALSSAMGVALMFLVLSRIFDSDKTALWLAIVYAFGTPVFFRTGYLNHNLVLGHIAFLGFVLLWNPLKWKKLSDRSRYLVAGLAGGTAVLFDYSGGIFLLGLFGYGLFRSWHKGGWHTGVHEGAWYVVGTVAPVLLLWFYQWQSFGHPFFPGQHWMPPVTWIERGYQGVGWPQGELFAALTFDYRFGLFVTCPVLLLALVAPWAVRSYRSPISQVEVMAVLGVFGALLALFSGVNYTRLQFNTGIRYLAPILPFLFILAALTLMRLPHGFRVMIGLMSIVEGWALAMYRDVERGLGVLDPLLQVFWGGFQLPMLNTLSRLETQFGEFFPYGPSPLPLFVVTAGIVWVIWCGRFRENPDRTNGTQA